MDKTKTKPEVKIKLTITPGPVTPAQREAARRFWQRLIAKAKSEAAK